MQKQYLQKTYLKNNNEESYILVLDVGTTSVKGFVFDEKLNLINKVSRRIEKIIREGGCVEQNPDKILDISKSVLRDVIKVINKDKIIGLGVTNQRETTILWDTQTGKSIYPAIVWEDVRTDNFCDELFENYDKIVRQKTGLNINSYFSASKIKWVLDNVPQAKELLKNNHLAFGTVDTWILWNFLEGQPHITDYTNASRTLLFDIKTLEWDKELLNIFDIPKNILPKVVTSGFLFGNIKKNILDVVVPVRAVLGDQQSSMYAAGKEVGVTKVTYGTGAFVMQILGSKFETVQGFATTLVAGDNNKTYAIEAKVDNCGKRIDLVLKNGNEQELKMVLTELAMEVDKHIKKLSIKPKELVIDGGGIRDGYLLTIQKDVSGIPTKKHKTYDGTALGVAKLAVEMFEINKNL